MSAHTTSVMDWDAIEQAARHEGVHLFGAGRFARDVAAALQQRGCRVHAFLVSNPPSLGELDGIPVRQLSASALATVPLWVGVFNREGHSDYAALHDWFTSLAPQARIVWPQAFYGALAQALGFRFWLHALDDYAAEQNNLQHARALLADEASRHAFDAVLAFRTQAPRFNQPPQPCDEVQYLPTWLRQRLHASGVNSLRLVDAGAYRGETVHELGSLMPIEHAWTFEPDAENYAHLVRNFPDWPTPITHVPAGLADKAGFAAFTPGQGESCRLSAEGTHHVPVVALDECLHRTPVNFIKFDLEGHEMTALQGAIKTLQANKPTLAIAGYHRWDDLWRIPFWISEHSRTTDIYFALHGHNTFDGVFYATSR